MSATSQIAEPSSTTAFPRGRLAALTWSHLLNDGASNYLPGVLPAVLAALSLPARMAGVLIAALTIGQALQPLTGWLADRLGGRLLVTGGLLFSSLGGALLGAAHSTWSLIVLLLMIGAGNAFFHPQALAGVRSMLAGRQGFLTSVFLVGGELGRGIWPTAASLVVSHLGLGGLWIVGVPGLLTVPILFRHAPRLAAASHRQAKIRWRNHAKPMALLMSYRCVRSFTTYALVTFIPIMWHARHGSLVSGASIVSTMTIVGVVGNLSGGHLADKIGRRPVLLASALSAAVLIVPIAYIDGAWMWVLASALGIALFLTTSPTILIGQDIFPENRSMGSGIALGFANGVGALLVLLIGLWLSDNDIDIVFWVVAALSAASGFLALLFPARLMRGR